MKKYNYIIIDGNNLFWRCFNKSLHRYIVVDNHQLFPGVVEEALSRIRLLKKSFAYDSTIFYFCFDNPDSVINIRKILDENYKSHRLKKNVPKGLYKTLNIFVEILKCYSDNYRVINAESLEADDFTLPIIESIKDKLNKNNKCLLVSNDLDWARNLSLSEFCSWWDYKEVHDRDIFYSKYDFYPVAKKIELYKAIHGDPSDSIKNAVPYLPKEILIDIVNSFDDVKDLFKNLFKKDYPEKWKDKIKDAEGSIKLNFNLIEFIAVGKSIDEFMWVCKLNIKKLKYLFDIFKIEHEYFMKSDKERQEDIMKSVKQKGV